MIKTFDNLNILPISAFIITKNEEVNLSNCIESLERCSEIIIVDSGSTDGTEELVNRYKEAGWPITFIYEPWRGYARQKQFALEQCRQTWCLSMDGDERLCMELQQTLPTLISQSDDIVGWRLRRRPYLPGFGYTPKTVNEGWILRLIRRGKGEFDTSQIVHEGIIPDGDIKNCPTGSILHYRPAEIDTQILKENKYSSLKADYLYQNEAPTRTLKLFLNPPWYFIRFYIVKGFWKCGIPGFIFSATSAIYSFMTEAKLYQRHATKKNPPFDDLDGTKEMNIPGTSLTESTTFRKCA